MRRRSSKPALGMAAHMANCPQRSRRLTAVVRLKTGMAPWRTSRSGRANSTFCGEPKGWPGAAPRPRPWQPPKEGRSSLAPLSAADHHDPLCRFTLRRQQRPSLRAGFVTSAQERGADMFRAVARVGGASGRRCTSTTAAPSSSAITGAAGFTERDNSVVKLSPSLHF